MAILTPTKRNHLTPAEKAEMISYLQEVHEGTTAEIKYIDGVYRIMLDGEYDGEILECSECGHKYDGLFEGNCTFDLDYRDECNCKITDYKLK